MALHYWLQGIGLGFAIAAPVGPIGLLCIRRTLVQGRLVGLVSGLGAATADGIYGCVAGFGLSAVTQWMLAWAEGLRWGGGLFLCYLGIKTLLSSPEDTAATAPSSRSLAGAYGSTLVLTLTNPATILSFIAIFAGLGVAAADRAGAASLLVVAGVFTGSALWWLLLSGGVGLMRERLTSSRLLGWINRGAGAAILAFGLGILTLKQ